MRDETSGPEGDAVDRPGDRKITVAGARRMLGMIGRNYDDDQIGEVLDVLYGIAEVAYDKYLDGDQGDDEASSET